MTRRRGTASLVASPVLVGAVTVLIAIIAVFIAYNANAGLPFVPTYDVKAELPTGAKLVRGNEVRTGGFRVGVVDDITPKQVTVNGRTRSVAVVAMKLDKTIEPLKSTTRFEVRPRSALGLKYVQLTPGPTGKTLAPGDTTPLRNADEKLELEDVLATFDPETRVNNREALAGFGEAFAGRGPALNSAIQALNPLFRYLTPVARVLSRRDTRLDNFFRQLGRAAAEVAPIAEVNAQLFTNMADTFQAISANPEALRQTISESPPTLDTGTRSLRVQRPFLNEFAVLSRKLRPAARELPRSLPAINAALSTGTPVLARTPPLNARLEDTFEDLDSLFKNPNTLLAIRDIRTALTVTKPALEFIGPYQTVCSYANYWFSGLADVFSQTVAGGTTLSGGLKLGNLLQENHLGNSESSRPVDIPVNQNPIGATAGFQAAERLYTGPYQPAVDAQGNADCQLGQNGWIKGPLHNTELTGGLLPFPRGETEHGDPTGVNWTVTKSNFPILSGGTYKSRELGIDNLRDVP